jgi:hypothetical protein
MKRGRPRMGHECRIKAGIVRHSWVCSWSAYNLPMLQIPTLQQAEALLSEAGARNPGPWVPHSRNVAEAAQRIAARVPGMDGEAAYVLGLLHDMGRREGVTGMRHVLDGYRRLSQLGYEHAARINMTHSFANGDIREVFGEWDCSDEELAFIEAYLARIEFDDYDRLIQLCDALAMADGFVLMEKRLVDVAVRYGAEVGVSAYSIRKWRKKFEIRADFERRLGCSIYDLLPGVVENTFKRG